MNNYALGHLPIELTRVGNNIILKPIYFPIDDDEFRKIWYKTINHPPGIGSNLHLCLEIEDGRHRFIRRRIHLKKNEYSFFSDSSGDFHFKTKLYNTKFYAPQRWRWTIDQQDLNNSEYTININEIYDYVYNTFDKHHGWKFKIRGTYRYSYRYNEFHGDNSYKLYTINYYNYYTRTNIFSNELELILPDNYL